MNLNQNIFEIMQYNSATRLSNFHNMAQKSSNELVEYMNHNCKRVAEDSVYIFPKNIPKQESCEPEEFSSQQKDNHQPPQQILQKPSLSQKIQKQRTSEPNHHLAPIDSPEKISKKQYDSHFWYYLQILVWLGFLVASVPGKQFQVWVDIGVNVVCLGKIVVYHGYVYYLNRKQLNCSEQKYKQHQKQQQHQKEHYNSPKKPHYHNSIRYHELLQIWSILVTIIGLFFIQSDLIFKILISCKVLRLFFPVAIAFAPRTCMPTFQVFWHILKLIVIGAAIILLFAIFLSYLYTENSHYRCISTQELSRFYDNNFTNFSSTNYQVCGITKPCPSQQCLNIYRYSHSQKVYEQVSGAYRDDDNLASYDKSMLNSFLQTLNPGAIFNKYKVTQSIPILFGLFLVLWYVGICWGAVEVGETLRCQTLHDWQQKQRKQVCYYPIKDQSLLQKRRNSNISFNIQRYRKQICRQQIPSEQQQTHNEYLQQQMTLQFARITEEMTNRSLKQKLATVLFNLVCLSQVVLVFVDELNLDIDRNINLCLGVYFILWSVGLLLAVVQFRLAKITEKEGNYVYTLWFQGAAYLLALLDYIVRLCGIGEDGQFVIERENFITPIAHAALSLRIVYILYNNGFDSQISCYFQKILRNIWSNSRMIFFILVTGLSAGFVQVYWRYDGNYNTSTSTNAGAGDQSEFLKKEFDVINNWTLMSSGFGGTISNTLDGILLFSIFKIIGTIYGLYIAKNVNIGYDSIFDAQFPTNHQQQDPQTIQNIILQQNSLNCISSENCFRKFCLFLHSVSEYSTLKCIALLVYCIFTFVNIFEPINESSTSKIILLVLDVWLIVDIFTQIVANRFMGKYSYLDEYKFLKIFNFFIQLFLFIAFFIPSEQLLPYTVFFRLTRSIIITQNITVLTKITNQIVTIMFKSKLKYYKVVLCGLALLLIGLVVTARFVGGKQLMDGGHKVLNALGFSINFVFGIGFAFQTTSVVDSINVFCMNIIATSFIIFFHIITVFLNVMYFVVTRNQQSNQQDDLVLQQFISSNPQDYNYTVNSNSWLYSYMKVLKISIIFVSCCEMCILFGLLEYKVSTETRIFLATINLFLVFVEIFVYFYENVTLKLPRCQWPIIEGILIVVSLPGTFFLMFSTNNFEGALQLKMVIQFFVALSTVRLCRIIPLMINRQAVSCQIVRRVYNTVPFAQFTGILLLLISLMLPFATFLAILHNRSIIQQIFNFIGGPSFAPNPHQNPQISELLAKLLANLIYLPLKSFCFAKIISSFLTNKPTWLTLKKDKIKTLITKSGILDHNRSNLYVKSNQFYRIAAGIVKIIPKNKQMGVMHGYEEILQIVRNLNIQVFVAEEDNQEEEGELVGEGTEKNYALLVSDLIYYIYLYITEIRAQFSRNQILSLTNKSQTKPDKLSKTNMGTHQFAILMGMKNKLIYRIAKQTKQKLSKSSNQ